MSEAPQPAAAAPKPQNIDYNYEVNRLASFVNWTVAFIDKNLLALLGFYYFGPSDMVKCHFCGVEIGMWEEGDDVLTDHMRWSPSCGFIRRNQTSNVPINAARLDEILPPAPEEEEDIFGLQTVSEGTIESISEDDVHMNQHFLFARGGIDAVVRDTFHYSPPTQRITTRPDHPQYAVEANRIESYEDWPKTMRQKPQQLSDAGFFYTGKGDRVCCFSCSGGLKDWEENDDPWEQHGMWYGKCEYLKLMKGQDFITQMAKKREELCNKNKPEALPSSSSSSLCAPQAEASAPIAEASAPIAEKKTSEKSSSDEEEEEIKDAKLCKICYTNEYNTIFLPCGHIIACAKCASSVTKCPACRQPFETVMRIYFS
jgi:E3 ubiquitin-protein ligase XIAP